MHIHTLTHINPYTKASVVRQHSCDYESNSLCGWVPGPFQGRGMSGIANASHPPPLGPHIDADPGTPDGKNWVYIYSLLLLLLLDFEMLLLQIQFWTL